MQEQVEFGEFECRAINEDGAEIRLSDERYQQSVLLRKKALAGKLERGATYTLLAVKKSDAPQPATVAAILPAEDVGTLPKSAEIKKDGATEHQDSTQSNAGTQPSGASGGSEAK